MMFKIGDKAKIISYPNDDRIGETGVITGVYPATNTYPYRLKVSETWDSLMMKHELEPAAKIGEQLLLFEL